MPTSGSSPWFPKLSEILDEAFEIGMEADPATVSQRHLTSAMRSYNRVLVDMDNEGNVISRMDRQSIQISAGQTSFFTPNDTLGIDQMHYRRAGSSTEMEISETSYLNWSNQTNKGQQGTPSQYSMYFGRPRDADHNIVDSSGNPYPAVPSPFEVEYPMQMFVALGQWPGFNADDADQGIDPPSSLTPQNNLTVLTCAPDGVYAYPYHPELTLPNGEQPKHGGPFWLEIPAIGLERTQMIWGYDDASEPWLTDIWFIKADSTYMDAMTALDGQTIECTMWRDPVQDETPAYEPELAGPQVLLWPVPDEPIEILYNRIRLSQEGYLLGENPDIRRIWTNATIMSVAADLALKFNPAKFTLLKNEAAEAMAEARKENRSRAGITIGYAGFDLKTRGGGGGRRRRR